MKLDKSDAKSIAWMRANLGKSFNDLRDATEAREAEQEANRKKFGKLLEEQETRH